MPDTAGPSRKRRDDPWPDVPETRRKVMRANKAKDTKPEMTLRSLLHRAGYRFRLHRRDLPGSPDLVFPSRRKVVFVHGCYWHGHVGCDRANNPKTRSGFWEAKFERNRARDARNLSRLSESGWESLVVWECELRDPARVLGRASAFLGEAGRKT